MLEIVITMHNPDFIASIYGESAVLRDLTIHVRAMDITTAETGYFVWNGRLVRFKIVL